MSTRRDFVIGWHWEKNPYDFVIIFMKWKDLQFLKLQQKKRPIERLEYTMIASLSRTRRRVGTLFWLMDHERGFWTKHDFWTLFRKGINQLDFRQMMNYIHQLGIVDWSYMIPNTNKQGSWNYWFMDFGSFFKRKSYSSQRIGGHVACWMFIVLTLHGMFSVYFHVFNLY